MRRSLLLAIWPFLFVPNIASAKTHAEQSIEDLCQNYLREPLPSRIARLGWLADRSSVLHQLETLSSLTDLGFYIRGLLLALNNPHLDHETKVFLADRFADKTGTVPIEDIWPLFRDLATSRDPKSRVLAYTAMAGRHQLPEPLINAVPRELSNGNSEMILAIAGLIGDLERISDPRLIQALRDYYLKEIPGHHPKRSEWSANAPDHVNAYNQRMTNRMNAVWFQVRTFYLLFERSTLERKTFFNDCKKILFTSGSRQYRAFQYLIEHGQLDSDLIAKFVANVNDFRNVEFGATLTESAAKILEHAERQSELDILIVELLKNPSVGFRSSLLAVLKDRTRPLHAEALRRLREMIPALTGQTHKIAQRLISLTQSRVSEFTTQEAHIQRMWRGLLGDSVHDALHFPSLTEAEKSKLRPLLAENGEVRSTAETLTVLRSFNWGVGALESHSLGDARNWMDLPPLPWRAVDPHEHSMPDLERYIHDRIGKNLAHLAKTTGLRVHVMAATEEDVLSRSDISLNMLKKIPNPYSTWDIDRYLDLSSKDPRLIIRIQPNIHLARHYQAMLTQTGTQSLKVSVCAESRIRLKEDFKKASQRVLEKLGHTAQVVVFGYEYLWQPMLEKTTGWKIHSTSHAEAIVGLAHVRAQRILVSSSSKPELTREILVVGSDRTLWGETTVHFAESMISSLPRARDLTFLGSAGSLGFGYSTISTVTGAREKNIIYGISIPHHYVDEIGGMYQPNPLNWEVFCSNPTVKDMEVGPNRTKTEVALCSNHGFSTSPVEQSVEFTSQMVAKHISTLDVETGQLARFVKNWNDSHPAQRLAFNVAHLITDNPASNQLIWDTNNSLSAIDSTKKQQARENLLAFVLEKWQVRFQIPAKKRRSVLGVWEESLGWNEEEAP